MGRVALTGSLRLGKIPAQLQLQLQTAAQGDSIICPIPVQFCGVEAVVSKLHSAQFYFYTP
jgi:hypothetical protein